MDDRFKAQRFRKDKDYKSAVKVYENIWSNLNENNIDKWIGWEYADSLKKIGNIDKSISICKQVYHKEKNFKYINDLLSWCLYEKYFKNLNGKEKNLIDIENIANFIVTITRQESTLPYENTIWKMVDIYKTPFKVCKVNEWVDKLDIELLSDKGKDICVNKREIEILSPQEKWYLLKCKCLVEMGRYDKCIELCDLAMNVIKKFHNDTDIWIQKNKAESMGNLGREKEAIELLEMLLKRKDHWVIHKTIFDIYIKLKNYEEGLKYAYRAALTTEPDKLKVNLYFKIGQVLEMEKNYKYALIHYKFSKKIREDNNWNIPNELESSINRIIKIENFSKDIYKENIRDFWAYETTKYSKRYEGLVFKILPKGKSGFIKTDEKCYYFKIDSIIRNKKILRENIKVSFSLADSYDKKKNKKTKEAINIIIM